MAKSVSVAADTFNVAPVAIVNVSFADTTNGLVFCCCTVAIPLSTYDVILSSNAPVIVKVAPVANFIFVVL